MSITTTFTCSFHPAPRASSQLTTAFEVRPALWPRRPPGPDRSTKLVSKRSSRVQRPPSSLPHRGRPRRVSSIPSTSGAAGSTSSRSAWATNAACTIGQLIGSSPVTEDTDRPEPTATAAARRHRPVIRAYGGHSPIDSVNAFRGHCGSRHRNCVLCHRTTSGASQYGKSLGRVERRCLTELENTPAPRARRRGLVRGPQVHRSGTLSVLLDTIDRYSGQPEQNRRTVLHARGSSHQPL